MKKKNEKVKAAETLNAVNEFYMEYREYDGSKISIEEGNGNYVATVFPIDEAIYTRTYTITLAELSTVVSYVILPHNKTFERYASEKGFPLIGEELVPCVSVDATEDEDGFILPLR